MSVQWLRRIFVLCLLMLIFTNFVERQAKESLVGSWLEEAMINPRVAMATLITCSGAEAGDSNKRAKEVTG